MRMLGLAFLAVLAWTDATAEARAHWLDRATIAWQPTSGEALDLLTVALEARTGAAPGEAAGEDDAQHVALMPRPGGLTAAQRARWPHLGALPTFSLPALAPEVLAGMLRGELRVTAARGAQTVERTGLQIAGVLDDLFAYDGPLGVTVDAAGRPSLRLWAPTARAVRLVRYASARAAEPLARYAMAFDAATGVWSIHGQPNWLGDYYRYEVTVFAPSTGRVEVNEVTDPYALALSTDSQRSQLVDLTAPGLAPDGWGDLPRTPFASPADLVLYELHVRDFSADDETVPEPLRGTYLAFTRDDSDGMRHLRRLADAGVTHVHLLPVFDIATIPERRADQVALARKQLLALPPDSPRQQALIGAVRAEDAYNWGYDPWHYTVPEGSYATQPEGQARIREFRAMVLALRRAGLRVVLDVVYNHTHAAGQDPKSVLDRIVPGYYHRLDGAGAIETSTCCENTASEHRMMEKLLIDSVLTWARHYRIDGFRFDLMGHHSRQTMLQLRAALDELTIEDHGVDGRAIVLYGEGWNFGEVADDARFVQASQLKLGGSGIGTFNDRLRDGVRGGSPSSAPRDLGFVNGLAVDPNAFEAANGEDAARLGELTDWIRIGLAANLAAFELETASGERRRADQLTYRGAPVGYAVYPQETISYVAAHDNETLFDANQLKLPLAADLEARIHVQTLASAIVLLGQGVPFIHAGQEILRSKSLDRDSYDSGDWFNAIDWSLETGHFGRGLPPAWRNEAHWELLRPFLASPRLAPGPEHRRQALDAFLAYLRIRRDTPLFRLGRAERVLRAVRFHDTGPDGTPGLIVMSVSDDEIGGPWRRAIVLFNARPEPARVPADALAELEGLSLERLRLHPYLEPLPRAWGPAPGAAGALHAPARTAAVFVEPR